MSTQTARGGGVAEMLQSLLAYARGAGVDVRCERHPLRLLVAVSQPYNSVGYRGPGAPYGRVAKGARRKPACEAGLRVSTAAAARVRTP